MIHFKTRKENALTPKEKKELKELLLPIFSFSYHFTQSYKRNHTLYFSSRPTWRVLMYDNNELIGSLSIVRRVLKKQELAIGGIGSFGIKESHQGKGYGKKLLAYAHDFMRKEEISASLLFCTEHLCHVYESSGYIRLQKPVTYYSKGKLDSEPVSFLYPISMDANTVERIKTHGLHIGRGSW